jgi:hypothetical protein
MMTKDGPQIYDKDWATERRDLFGRGGPLSAGAWESQTKLAKNNIPRHVGFIPDGNRRWATAYRCPEKPDMVMVLTRGCCSVRNATKSG